jgi:hypothetical protein
VGCVELFLRDFDRKTQGILNILQIYVHFLALNLSILFLLLLLNNSQTSIPTKREQPTGLQPILPKGKIPSATNHIAPPEQLTAQDMLDLGSSSGVARRCPV